MNAARCAQAAWRSCLAVAFLSVQLGACAPLRFAPYEAKAAGAYPNHVVKGDLQVAAQPLVDEQEQRKYFGVVLTDVGVLPVFIVAENRSTTRRFLLRDDSITLQSIGSARAFPKAVQDTIASDPGGKAKHDAALATTGAAVVAGPIFLALPAVLMAVGFAKNSEGAALIQDNLFDKTLFTRTVLPGRTVSGFAYFMVSDTKLVQGRDMPGSLGDLLLRAQVADQETAAIHDFEFRM